MPVMLTLRRLLFVDAAGCAVMGTALAVAAGPLAALTMIGPSFLFRTGLILIAVAAVIGAIALPRITHRAGVAMVLAGNVGWVVASLGIVGLGIIAPNTLGAALVVTQAVAVAVLTGLEWAAASRHGAAGLGAGHS
jgi:hypothetical protein